MGVRGRYINLRESPEARIGREGLLAPYADIAKSEWIEDLGLAEAQYQGYVSFGYDYEPEQFEVSAPLSATYLPPDPDRRALVDAWLESKAQDEAA